MDCMYQFIIWSEIEPRSIVIGNYVSVPYSFVILSQIPGFTETLVRHKLW